MGGGWGGGFGVCVDEVVGWGVSCVCGIVGRGGTWEVLVKGHGGGDARLGSCECDKC
jgi:hypothetical protein